MPAAPENLPALEQQLYSRLLEFARLDDEWPKGATALIRAKIGRRHSDALSDIAELEKRIFEARAESLDDAAVQLRRLAAVMDEIDTRRLLSSPGVRRLVNSVLDAVERSV
ncbi:MAG: hypothetical protein O7F69_03360 [Alphaproteobacteria bacterium]|nr:hypothetical protein [Alphaproteobacteria bacterium]